MRNRGSGGNRSSRYLIPSNRLISDMRPYRCSYCARSYKSRQSMKEHEYQCPYKSDPVQPTPPGKENVFCTNLPIIIRLRGLSLPERSCHAKSTGFTGPAPIDQSASASSEPAWAARRASAALSACKHQRASCTPCSPHGSGSSACTSTTANTTWTPGFLRQCYPPNASNYPSTTFQRKLTFLILKNYSCTEYVYSPVDSTV